VKIGTFIPILEAGWKKEADILLQEKFSHFELLPENQSLYDSQFLKKRLVVKTRSDPVIQGEFSGCHHLQIIRLHSVNDLYVLFLFFQWIVNRLLY